MHNTDKALLHDLMEGEAAAAEDRLLQSLRTSVVSRKKLRSFKRLGLLAVFVLFGFAAMLNIPLNNPALDNNLVQDTVVPSVAPSLIYLPDRSIAVNYVRTRPNIEYLETRSIAVRIVSDAELEATFSKRAYAVLENETTGIQGFHLLDTAY